MRTKVYDYTGRPGGPERIAAVDGVDRDRDGVRIVIPNSLPKALVMAQLRQLMGEIRRSHVSPMDAAIELARAELGDDVHAWSPEGLPCPECGSAMREHRSARARRPYYACSAFPRCRYTEPMPDERA